MSVSAFFLLDCCKASGKADVSLSSKLLSDSDIRDEEEFDIKWLTASLYSGKVHYK